MIEYEFFFNYSLDMFVIAGLDGYFKRANPAFCNMLGYSESALLSRPFIEFVHPEDVETVEGAMKNLASGHPAFMVQVRLLAVDGLYRRLEWMAYPDLKAGWLFAIARNYSLVPYNISNQQFKLLIDSSPTAIFLVEQTGIISYCNHLAELIFDYKKNQLLGQPIEMLIPEKYHKQHLKHREQYTINPEMRPMGVLQNLVGCRQNGDEFPIDVGLNPVRMEHNTIIICSVIDTSLKDNFVNTLLQEKKRLAKENSRLARLAYHDTLTGLYNRRAFERILHDNLADARKYKESISILLVDIDHFKKYNDTYGHIAGDHTLKHLGEFLANNIRKEDTAARIGGEEFIIILPGIQQDQSTQFAERLRKLIEDDESTPHPITVSMGAATHQFKSKNGTAKNISIEMIANADKAVYHSKNTGRNKVTHFSDMSE